MQDHSHKLLFMAVTGAMCAVVFYGSEAASALLTPAEEFSPAATDNTPSPLRDDAGASLLPPRAGESLVPDKAGASVLPNSASCPAADALVSPPRVNEVIGKEPGGVAGAPAQAARTANLGTGSPCPLLRADAAKPGSVPQQAQSTPSVPNFEF